MVLLIWRRRLVLFFLLVCNNLPPMTVAFRLQQNHNENSPLTSWLLHVPSTTHDRYNNVFRATSQPRNTKKQSAPPSRLRLSLDDNNDGNNERRNTSISPIYLFLATAETIFWYWLAPGIDPTSRWFAPADASFITEQLLNPSIVFSPPTGSGIGFSSLLLNSFLILPAVWSILLLQEDGKCIPKKQNRQIISPLPFCAASFFVGGGALIPYMIVRRAPNMDEFDPKQLPALLKLFEQKVGPTFLSGLLCIILTTFAWPFVMGNYDFGVEWAAFLDRLQSSQFTSLALVDFTMISLTIIDPMMEDAKRRGYLLDIDDDICDNKRYYDDKISGDDVIRLAPFVFLPLVGPVAWICIRPKYYDDNDVV